GAGKNRSPAQDIWRNRNDRLIHSPNASAVAGGINSSRGLRERAAAAAGAGGIGILEDEALAHERVLVIHYHALQMDKCLGIDEYTHASEFEYLVGVAGVGVIKEFVGLLRDDVA